MVQFNTLEDLSGQPITRQTLFDMWRNSNLQTIQSTDLADGVLPIVSQASEPSAAPGSLWHDTTRDAFYLYVDEIAGTACSLWIGIGPDIFETPCLAAQPIPPGAAVELVCDRWVRPVQVTPGNVIGFNQAGVHWPLNQGISTTAASGTWIPVAFEGIVAAFEAESADSLTFYNIQSNFPVSPDPRNPGGIISSGNFHAPQFNPTLGINLIGGTYSAGAQLGSVHFQLVQLYHPRKSQGLT